MSDTMLRVAAETSNAAPQIGVNPLYVLVNKKGLNQGGRVVKEYDDYSKYH